MHFRHHWKYILPGAVLSIALIYFASGITHTNKEASRTTQAFQAHIAASDLHSSGFFEFAELLLSASATHNDAEEIDDIMQLGITAHHLPTAHSFIESFYSTLQSSQGPRDIFVIVGPDHFERCNSNVAVTSKSYSTPFGVLSVNTEIVDALTERVAEFDDDCFEGEHSIGVQTIFIKQKFPDAEIVPILFSASTNGKELELISEVLSEYLDRITVVASVDFSHYKSYDQAQILDNQTERAIKNLDTYFLTLEHADSPPSVNLLVLLARQLNARPVILGRANSYIFTGRYNNTTGYINVVFRGNLNQSSQEATLIFVGDVMLDRRVDEIFKERGGEMFGAVRELAQMSDFFIFNHEGTVPDKDIPQDLKSLFFSFRHEPLTVLREAGANIAGLANNHSYNFGKDIFTQTQNNLVDIGFEVFGTPNSEISEYEILKKEIRGKRIVLYGYNQFGGDRNKTAALLQGNIAQGQLDIVFAHWGEEYQKQPNAFQKETAQLFFDAGADVIIGHHSHVVQPYEKIGDKLVFYSLGNFIFDQDFLEATQYGLALKVLVEENKASFILIPISLKQSIPRIDSLDLLDNENLYPGFSAIRTLEITDF